MDKSLFNELVGSLKEAQAISQGKIKASRRFIIEPIDAKVVRDNMGPTQSLLAHPKE
jgi:hypothetical protein